MSVVLERPDLPAPDAARKVPGPHPPFLERLQDGVGFDDTASRLVDRALGLWTRPGFETFASLPRLRLEPFDYQLRAAEIVLSRGLALTDLLTGLHVYAALPDREEVADPWGVLLGKQVPGGGTWRSGCSVHLP